MKQLTTILLILIAFTANGQFVNDTIPLKVFIDSATSVTPGLLTPYMFGKIGTGGGGGYAPLASPTFTTKASIVGSSSSDDNIAGSELATASGSGTNWTTSAPTAGTTHTPGSTTAFTSPLAAVISTYYQIIYTVSGRTAGTVTISFGGVTLSGVNFNTTNAVVGMVATSTAGLSYATTTDFDGTIAVSVKPTYNFITPVLDIQKSSLASFFKILTPGTNNHVVGNSVGSRLFPTANNNYLSGYSTANLVMQANNSTVVGVNAMQNAYNLFNADAFGYNAGSVLNDGSTPNRGGGQNSMYLGGGTRANNSGAFGEIVIGPSTQGHGNNTVSIGPSGITGNYFNGTIYSSGGAVALLTSPTFTGTPSAPTATVGTNTTQIATTAFVAAAVGASGQTALVAGTKAITISGLTTSSKAQVTFVSVGGTVTTTWQYAAVCTANTLTITALTNTGTTDTSDTSTINYSVTQ